MKFELPALPYAKDALEPYISERTVTFHYEKHHAGYMKKLDAALDQDDPLRGQTLEEVILGSEGGVFNAAAQVWNHTFYWTSLAPGERTQPSGALAAAIDESFGSLAELNSALVSITAGEFGSGWGWLVRNDDSGRLEVVSTTDAENPLGGNLTPLLTLDVWEHAYYLDYQNERGRYLQALVENLLNWEFASANFS